MNRDVACVVCGSHKNVCLYEVTFSGSVATAAEYFLSHRKAVAHGQILRCGDCGFVFTSPQFTPAEYSEIYQRVSAQSKGKADPIFQAAEKIRFARLSKFVRQYTGEGSFLDFGCGHGGFLDIMDDDRGLGFEVGPPGSRQSSAGHKIVTGNFLELAGQYPFADEAFSFITAFDVLEHLPDLPLYIDALRGMTQQGGHVIVTVPNIASIVARMAGKRWNMILLEHLWYFTPKTLCQLFESHGFEHVVTRSIPYDAQLSHLINRVAQTYRINIPTPPQCLGSLVLPIPIGLMASVFKRL